MIQKNNKYIAIAILLLGIMLIIGCAEDDSDNTSSQNDDIIKVGVILPFSGECGAFGSAELKAIQLAVNEINDAGGVLGREIELVVRDSKTDPLSASLNAMDLIENEGVIAILGADNSQVSLEMLDAVSDMNTFIISGSATSDSLKWLDEGYYHSIFYRTVPDVIQEANTLAKHLIFERGDSVVRLLCVNDCYGNSFINWFSLRYGNYGGRIEKIVKYTTGEISYSAEIESLFAPVVDTMGMSTETDSIPLVVLVGYPKSGAQIIRDWRTSGYDARWILTSNLKTKEFITMAGAQNTEGIRGIAPYSGATSEQYIRYEYFKDAYKDMWNIDPRNYRCLEHWYDATILLAYAILSADTTDPSVIRDSLSTVSIPPGDTVSVGQFAQGRTILMSGNPINYNGASGYINIDEYGDNNTDYTYEIYEIQNGTFVHILETDPNP